MASPFRYFRKHTKAFMATAAVLAIFIFVVGGALSTGRNSSSSDNRSAGALVATWNGGSLNQGQLGSLVQQRLIVDQFLKTLFSMGGGQSGYDLPSSIPVLLLRSQKIEEVESDVIGTEVMAEMAAKVGMTVSVQMINHYIEEMGLKKVGGDQIEMILSRIGSGNARQNEAIVFSMLRKMLLAHFYRQMYNDQSMVVLPQQRWDDWRKVNERISLQVAELPVEKFLPEVPNPTDVQLTAFYNEYKDADPNRYLLVGGRELPSPEPGLARPRRVRLQYLLGNVAERAEKLAGSVTEAEIKDYYERNKRLEFTKLDLPVEEPPAEEQPAVPPASSDQAQPGAATSPEAAPTGEAKPADTATPPATEATTPAARAPAAEPSEPGASEPAESTPPANPAPPASTESSEKESSSEARRSSPFRLVGFQAPPSESASEPSAATEEAAPESSANAPSKANEPPANAKPPAPAPAKDAAAAGATEAPPAQPATDSAAPATPAPASATPSAPAAPSNAEEVVEYEPLEKVRDEIRRNLATDKAVEELKRVMGEAAAELQAEYNRYGSQMVEARASNKKTPPPPQRLRDLKWLAEKFGLTYEETTPLTVRELFETAVGKAGDAESQAANVTQMAFTTLDLYEPFLAREIGGNWYVLMKIEDTPRKVPEFKDVRDEVVKAWKRREAAKLADKKSKELAAEAEKSPQPFDEFFSSKGFNVIKQTEFFSWRGYPVGREGTGTPPGLGDVPELKNVGPDFMETAFSLDGNKTVGLLNFDQSMAYVIRLNRRQYSEDELKKLFLEEEAAWPGRIDMLREHFSIFDNAVAKELLEERTGLVLDDAWLQQRKERLEREQN
jgi:hypothetical protein